MIQLDAEGRAYGDYVIARCDEPGCITEMPRDYLHTCMRCGGFFCWRHVGISDLGLLCGPCYEVRKNNNPKQIAAPSDDTPRAA